MKFFPSEQLEYHSPYTCEDMLERIKNSIEPVRYFHIFGDPEKKYEGTIKGSAFTISGITAFLNLANPSIQGEVQNKEEGCSILVTIQSGTVLKIICMFLFALLCLDLWPILYFAIVAGLDSVNFTLFIFHGVLLLILYSYGILGFQQQRKLARKYLAALFECRPVLVD